ncbi:MAG: PRC-barrel domain-containing protein [Chloroflexota bacterium]
MIARIAATVITSFVMFTGCATAQTTTSKDNSDVASKTSGRAGQRMWRSSKLIGLTVYNVTNEKIGTIQDFVVDKNAGVELVIIDVGGIIGMDERNLAVGYKLLKWVNTPVGIASPTSTTIPATTWYLETPKPDAPGTARERQWYPDHAVLAATKSQLKNMKTFEY